MLQAVILLEPSSQGLFIIHKTTASQLENTWQWSPEAFGAPVSQDRESHSPL